MGAMPHYVWAALESCDFLRFPCETLCIISLSSEGHVVTGECVVRHVAASALGMAGVHRLHPRCVMRSHQNDSQPVKVEAQCDSNESQKQ